MAKVSKVLLLPVDQKRWLDEQLSARVKHEDILVEAAAQGIPLTNGGLARYAVSWAAQVARVQLAAERARALVAAAGEGTDLTEAAAQVASSALLDRLLAITEEDLADLKLADAVGVLAQISRAETARRKLAADEARAAKKDEKAAAAAKKTATAGERVEATPEFIERVRRDIYGVKMGKA